jgi:hypothetical protein
MRWLIFLLVACGGDPNVGHQCSAQSPACDESLTCISTIPGGYCTASCGNPGTSADCPSGSICDDIGGGLGDYCVKLCNTTADCGRSDVQCNGVSGSNLKACKPN